MLHCTHLPIDCHTINIQPIASAPKLHVLATSCPTLDGQSTTKTWNRWITANDVNSGLGVILNQHMETRTNLQPASLCLSQAYQLIHLSHTLNWNDVRTFHHCIIKHLYVSLPTSQHNNIVNYTANSAKSMRS